MPTSHMKLPLSVVTSALSEKQGDKAKSVKCYIFCMNSLITERYDEVYKYFYRVGHVGYVVRLILNSGNATRMFF